MIIAAGAARGPRHHAHRKPVGRLQRRPVHAHVLHAGVGIAGDAQRRGQVGRGVEARRRHRHRQPRQPAAGAAQIVAGDDHLLARRGGDRHGRDRIGDRPHPGRADAVHRLAHAGRINVRRGRQRPDRHRHVVAPALGVGHIGEQEGAPLVFGQAAEKLPAHQRMQFSVLVDRVVDTHQQAAGFEVGEMGLEIRCRTARRRFFGGMAAAGGGRSVEHGVPVVGVTEPDPYRAPCHAAPSLCGRDGAGRGKAVSRWGTQSPPLLIGWVERYRSTHPTRLLPVQIQLLALRRRCGASSRSWRTASPCYK